MTPSVMSLQFRLGLSNSILGCRDEESSADRFFLFFFPANPPTKVPPTSPPTMVPRSMFPMFPPTTSVTDPTTDWMPPSPPPGSGPGPPPLTRLAMPPKPGLGLGFCSGASARLIRISVSSLAKPHTGRMVKEEKLGSEDSHHQNRILPEYYGGRRQYKTMTCKTVFLISKHLQLARRWRGSGPHTVGTATCFGQTRTNYHFFQSSKKRNSCLL